MKDNNKKAKPKSTKEYQMPMAKENTNDQTQLVPCRFEWNPGVWPYVAICVLAKGHNFHNHIAASGAEISVVTQ